VFEIVLGTQVAPFLHEFAVPLFLFLNIFNKKLTHFLAKFLIPNPTRIDRDLTLSSLKVDGT
jgi:hypothetical protein